MTVNYKAIFRILLILPLLLPCACRNSQGEPDNVPAVIEIVDRRAKEGMYHTVATASTDYIEVRTNISDWEAAVNGEAGGWLSAAPLREPETPATGVPVVQKLRIAAEANMGNVPRTAAVRLSGRGIECTLSVTQAAAGYILTFDTPVYAAAGGETLDIPVTANVGYTVSIPSGCNWLERAAAEDGNIIRLTAAPNVRIEERSTVLEVAADEAGLHKVLTVVQQGAEPAINIDSEEQAEIAWNDTELSLAVTANVAYRIDFVYERTGREWIWHAGTQGTASKQERFALDANEGAEPRRVRICFLSDDPSVSPAFMREVTVTQGGYTLPQEDVFELVSPARRDITYRRQSLAVEISTGMRADEVAVGGADGWIAADGEPVRIMDALVYSFAVDENNWPVQRSAVLTFSAGVGTIEVAVCQDANPVWGKSAEYDSLTGDAEGGAAGSLYDYDFGTFVLSGGSSIWPKQWVLGLKNPADNEFNRIVYYPAPGLGECGITGYELFALSAGGGTWHSAASGTVPASLYSNDAAMRKGCNIDFPTVRNARSLILRVEGTFGGGNVFGASEIHLVHDYTVDVQTAASISVQTASPATIGAGAGYLTVGVEATVPYKISLSENGGEPDWITYDTASSAPGTLAFSVAANTGARRSAVIRLDATGGNAGITKSITVVQEGGGN